MHFLLSGLWPFNGETKPKLMKEIRKGILHLDTNEWDMISTDAKAVI